jgi:hypothetical protein
MRALLLAALALMLTGCEHLYGAGDVRLSDAEAIRIARAEAARRHIVLTALEPAVMRSDTGVMITFDGADRRTAPCIDGGLPAFFIPAGSQRVTYVRTSY